jgi:predicted PurR-regulated permease PerM
MAADRGAAARRLEKASENLAATLREIVPHLKPLAGTVLAIAGSAGTGTLKFLASVVIARFLLPSGPRMVASVRTMLTRIVPKRSADFLALAGATIRTVAQGVIGVAVLQSLLAGIGLKIAGGPHAGVLAFAVLVLGIVQIGSAPMISAQLHCCVAGSSLFMNYIVWERVDDFKRGYDLPEVQAQLSSIR